MHLHLRLTVNIIYVYMRLNLNRIYMHPRLIVNSIYMCLRLPLNSIYMVWNWPYPYHACPFICLCFLPDAGQIGLKHIVGK